MRFSQERRQWCSNHVPRISGTEFVDADLELEHGARNLLLTGRFFCIMGTVHCFATIFFYASYMFADPSWSWRYWLHMGHFVRVFVLLGCGRILSSRCASVRPHAMSLVAGCVCIICAFTLALENPEVQLVHVVKITESTMSDFFGFLNHHAGQRAWQLLATEVEVIDGAPVESVLYQLSDRFPFNCAWNGHDFGNFQSASEFERCNEHRAFALNYVTCQMFVFLFCVFTHLPRVVTLMTSLVSQGAVVGVLFVARSPSLLNMQQTLLFLSLGFFIITWLLVASQERLRRMLFLFDVSAGNATKARLARVELDRMFHDSQRGVPFESVFGSISAAAAVEKALTNGDRMTLLTNNAIANEERMGHIVAASVDIVAAVTVDKDYRVHLVADSEVCTRIEAVFGVKVQSSFDAALAPSEAHRWVGYVRRCVDRPEEVRSREIIRVRFAGEVSVEADVLLSPSPDGGQGAFLYLSVASEVEIPSREVAVTIGATCNTTVLPPSARPAPAPSHKSGSSSSKSSCRLMLAGGDCLPPYGLVWVQGSDKPVELSSIKKGMRVLSFDPSCSPPMAFAEVQSADTVVGPASWVKVQMSDGTEALMTADHPVWPQPSVPGGAVSTGCVRAMDLVPGVNALPVHGCSIVPVQSVRSVPAAEAPAARVRLELSSADGESAEEQRSVFVTFPEEAGIRSRGSFVGVGDASAQLKINPLAAWHAESRNTFLSIVSPDEQTWKNGLRRSWSDPGLTTLKAADPGEARPEVEEDEEEVIVIADSNSCSMSSSSMSMGNSFDQVVIGSCDHTSGWAWSSARGWQPVPLEERAGLVRLSDITNLPISKETGERLSFGSIAHHTGAGPCKVCAFQARSDRVCRQGVLCPFCHCKHATYVRPSAKKRRASRSLAPSSVE